MIFRAYLETTGGPFLICLLEPKSIVWTTMNYEQLCERLEQEKAVVFPYKDKYLVFQSETSNCIVLADNFSVACLEIVNCQEDWFERFSDLAISKLNIGDKLFSDLRISDITIFEAAMQSDELVNTVTSNYERSKQASRAYTCTLPPKRWDCFNCEYDSDECKLSGIVFRS